MLDRRIDQLARKNAELTETHLEMQTELEFLQRLKAKQNKANELWEHQKVLQGNIKTMEEQINALRGSLLGTGEQTTTTTNEEGTFGETTLET